MQTSQPSLFEQPDAAKIFRPEMKARKQRRRQERIEKGEIPAPVVRTVTETAAQVVRRECLKQIVHDPALLEEVLQPRPCEQYVLHPVPQLKLSNDEQADVVRRAADELRDVYREGRYPPYYFDGRQEAKYDACADVELMLDEICCEVQEPRQLAIAAAIYNRAVRSEGIWATKRAALLDMKKRVIELANRLLPLFSTQDSFAFH